MDSIPEQRWNFGLGKGGNKLVKLRAVTNEVGISPGAAASQFDQIFVKKASFLEEFVTFEAHRACPSVS